MPQTDLRLLPKVELHRHVELTLRLSTLRELAPQAGIEVPADDAALKKELLVTEPMSDLATVLKKFLATQKILRSEEILTRITYETIEDAAAEGVRILELRYAPTYIRQGHADLTFDKIHRAFVRGIEKASHLPIAVGLMPLIQRNMPMEWAEEVTDFAIANKGDLIALDLADSEVDAEPKLFTKLFERARKAGLHITVHSGEANVPLAAQYVRDSIELLGAQRIGHGVQIIKDADVIKLVADRKVPLELCPTSNWLTQAVPSTAAHPFRQLMEQGVLVTINSDDPGIFDIDLTHEYEVLQRDQGFTVEEFNRINDVAAAASFLPLEKKQKHWPRKIQQDLAPLST